MDRAIASKNNDTASHFRKTRRTPESLQTEVLHYIEFLIEKQAKNSTQEKPTKRGGLGIWKYKIWMSDDFDEPLEDMKEYVDVQH